MENIIEQTGVSNRYLKFELGGEYYSLPLLDVREVTPPPKTTPLPNSPDYFVGVMNLRGQIVSIVDLRKKLRINAKEDQSQQAIVITEIEGVNIGLIVDAISSVMNVGSQDLMPLPEFKSKVNSKFIRGVFKEGEELVVLLDMPLVLDIQEIKNSRNKAS